ncbi:MAG TPA: peptidase T, partial [Lentisphaeria bacterium]|nr:peptidase T [Lentisphaeria bacterium]
LLGADDKAGIAEILTAVERVAAGDLPHGKLCIGFTPDEEIGEGPLHFDVADFGADYAYTLDGGAAGEIEFQNFNAATATFELRGRSVHPGSAKDVMINAQKVAFELDSLLPQDEVPEKTERFQGFYHLVHTSGSVGNARLVYLLRDHDAASFEARKRRMREAAETLNAKYGAGTVVLTIKDQYRNMEEIIRQHPFLIEIAEDAVRSAGIEPVIVPIRGGTDGATLSFKGLPCPNLGTGGYNFHGECEFASVQEMESSVQVILNIIKAFAGKK